MKYRVVRKNEPQALICTLVLVLNDKNSVTERSITYSAMAATS